MLTQPRLSATAAAQYIRMSTEHQRYSAEHQMEAIGQFAADRGLRIVRTYADMGKSGLTLAARPGLKQLLADVETGADFAAVLVYDVSRWGRFQDPDEAAACEVVCKRRGIQVHYCAEAFENDASPTSALLKSVKRMMAGEYSRELSTKVFAGQSRSVLNGFHRGGPAPYGLRRLLIGGDGRVKGLLAPGERRAIQSDHVKLVPGPPEEQEVIRWIYYLYIRERFSDVEIARILNAEEVPWPFAHPWAAHNVRAILTNPHYAGDLVYNRTSQKLRGDVVRHPPEEWVVGRDAIEVIVPRPVYDAAKAIRRSRYCNEQDLLEALSRLRALKGRITPQLINQASGMASARTYRSCFGSLTEAYRRIGYVQLSHSGSHKRRAARWSLRERVIKEVSSLLHSSGLAIRRLRRSNLIHVGEALSLHFVSVASTSASLRNFRHHANRGRSFDPDITLILVSPSTAERVLHFYMLPRRARLAVEYSWPGLAPYRCDSLEPLYTAVMETVGQNTAQSSAPL